MPLSFFGSMPASHHPLLIVIYSGIWRTGPSRGCACRRWEILRLSTLLPPPPNDIISDPPPSCTVLCSCVTLLRTAMAPACITGGTVGGGGFPPPVLPRCNVYACFRSAPSWQSASPPGHYTPKLVSSSAPSFPETPSCKFWASRTRLLFFSPVPDPPSTCHANFGSFQIVTPSPSPSRTQGSWNSPTVSPCNSSTPPSSDGYRICLPVTRPLGMDGRLPPWFFGHSSSAPLGQRVPSACQTSSGSTPGLWRLQSCRLRRKSLPEPSALPISAVICRRMPQSSIFLAVPLRCRFPRTCNHAHFLPLPGIPYVRDKIYKWNQSIYYFLDLSK